MEETLIIIKPLGLQNALLDILKVIKQTGTIVERRLVPVTRSLMSAHYAEHEGKEFFPRLVDYFDGQTVMVLRVEGPDIVARIRAIVGPSDPRKAAPGQLRRLIADKFRDGERGFRALELVTSGVDNLIHASDSPEAAEREIALWFSRS